MGEKMYINKKILNKGISLIFFSIMVLSFLTAISCSSIPAKLLPEEDDSAKTLLEKGRNLYDLQFLEKSIELYELVTEKYPEERAIVAWAYYEIGFIHFDKHEWEKALENFETVVLNYEPDNKAAYLLAYEFVRRIKYALETGNMEVLLHRSDYAIPVSYDPYKENQEDNENNEEETEENNEESEDTNNSNNTDDEENSQDESNNSNTDDNTEEETDNNTEGNSGQGNNSN